MKKVWKIILIIFLILVLVWPYPYPFQKRLQYLDGGTSEIVSLTYKVVWWNRLDSYEEGDPVKTKLNHTTKVYFFPNNFKSIDTLWEEAGRQLP